ncbi:Hypothetical protein NGAL_HAMBI2566_53990 [Neorhizobium galegae bv. orientalis]|nr:Hypothetical protein NGAL_HAMBI2566_53990 [Neorhizobium galegae bv. orientalis]
MFLGQYKFRQLFQKDGRKRNSALSVDKLGREKGSNDLIPITHKLA